jgi:hypothetical protein
VQSSINNLSDTYVKRNGETPMLAAFDVGSHKIIKLAEGTDDTDAVNV